LVADARRGRLPREVQPTEGGSYFSAAKESDFRIDWSRDAETLRRWITITPGKCFATVRGERVYLLDAKLAAGRRREKSENRVSNSRSTGILPVAEKHGRDARAAGGPPGTLLRIASAGCTIAAGQGAVRLERIRLPSGEELPLMDFCRQIGAARGECLATT
jgi:methionyl-tRNA formyltransferase